MAKDNKSILYTGVTKDGYRIKGQLFQLNDKSYIIPNGTLRFPADAKQSTYDEFERIYVSAYMTEVDSGTVVPEVIPGSGIFGDDVVRCWGGEYCQGQWEIDITFVIPHDGDLGETKTSLIKESENIRVIGNSVDNPMLLKLARFNEEKYAVLNEIEATSFNDSGEATEV